MGKKVFIIYKPLPDYPTWWYEKGVEMIVANLLRNPKEAMDPSIKSGNYLNNILALKQAKNRKLVEKRNHKMGFDWEKK